MSDEPLAQRALVGDWMGSSYWLGGERTEWTLSIRKDQTYHRTLDDSQETKTETGKWSYDPNQDILEFAPVGTGEATQYWVLDVETCARASTLLVLRWVALASRNLPILLYRVHHHPHGAPCE